MQSNLFLAGLISSALASCGGGSTPQSRAPESETSPATTTQPASAYTAPAPSTNSIPIVGEPPPAPLTDGQIAAVRHAMDVVQINEGRLAEQRTLNPRVRAFAGTVVGTHTRADQQRAALMSQLRIEPAQTQKSAAVANEGERTLESLRTVSGPRFDQAYIGQQVDQQERMLDTIENELIPNVRNAQLKAGLEDMRSKVEANLKEALDIRQELAVNKSG